MRKKKLFYIYVILALSHMLSITSLVMQRNEIIMTLSLLLKLYVTLNLLITDRSKIMVLSLLAQALSFGTAFVSGVIILSNTTTSPIIGIQSLQLQFAYIFMGVADALVILYVSRLSENLFLKRIYQMLSLIMISFISIGTLGFAFPVPTFLDVMVSVFEVTCYAGFVVTLLTELYLNTKSLKTEEI
ncbi:hypothetical protein [Erysipelothrix anatis]|uniref:hypothetical protein n=1 Tax=Erysipelothrix anatis TaxID=2683713 RepID=UPI001409CD29|nr:hypothetical protein [Erysipelothrix anatis]